MKLEPVAVKLESPKEEPVAESGWLAAIKAEEEELDEELAALMGVDEAVAVSVSLEDEAAILGLASPAAAVNPFASLVPYTPSPNDLDEGKPCLMRPSCAPHHNISGLQTCPKRSPRRPSEV